MLQRLPPELVIHVLSYLHLGTLCALHQVSHQWDNFLSANANVIYYSTAVNHNFVNLPEESPSSLNNALERLEDKLWRGVTSWREFCEYIDRQNFYHGVVY